MVYSNLVKKTQIQKCGKVGRWSFWLRSTTGCYATQILLGDQMGIVVYFNLVKKTPIQKCGKVGRWSFRLRSTTGCYATQILLHDHMGIVVGVGFMVYN